MFPKWREEVDVEELLSATLPKQSTAESVSTNEKLDLFADPILAFPPGKKGNKEKVVSSDEEVDLFPAPHVAPPLASSRALRQGKKGKQKKVASSHEELDLFLAPCVASPPASSRVLPQGKKGKGKKASPSAPSFAPIAPRHGQSHHKGGHPVAHPHLWKVGPSAG